MWGVRSVPQILWALQSPTLLNVYARGAGWNVSYTRMFGDCDGLAEETLLDGVREYAGGAVDCIVVCTQRQYDRARALFPGSRILWALHDGDPRIMPDVRDVSNFLTLSERVAAMHAGRFTAERRTFRMHVVRPFYEARTKWQWKPNCAWTMLSRPNTRNPEWQQNVERVISLSEVPTTIYGQDQPGGFLDRDARAALTHSCTAYVSALSYHAGFGLAEHEAMADGCPIVGTRWGDMPLEMSASYGLDNELEGVAQQLRKINSNRTFAESLSSLGLEFIRRHRTRERMEDDIRRLTEAPWVS